MVTCMICGQEFKKIGTHLKYEHSITVTEYRTLGYLTGCEKVCQNCGKVFVPTKSYRQFCSTKCCHSFRSHNYAVNLTSEALEFIYGHLLGDGSIAPHRRKAYYTQVSKYIDYLTWIENRLASFGIHRTGKIYKRKHNYNGWTYYSYQFVSLSYSELLSIREKWYTPDNGKQPPRDLVITPLMLKQWFMDDGHFRHPNFRVRYGKKYRRSATVRLCNRSFNNDSKSFLVEQLRSLELDGIIHPDYIHIPARYTKHFFSLIGSCPVPEVFGYKWPES